jgi:hypothetical protein
VSSTLAYAADISIVRRLSSPPANADPSNARWIKLTVLSDAGTRREFLCMTGLTSSDLVVSSAELDTLAVEICSSLDLVISPSN